MQGQPVSIAVNSLPVVNEPVPRPESPPLYAPFYFVSGYLVSLVQRTGVTPNQITVLWIGTMLGGAVALAVDRGLLAIVLLLISVLLDCLDGDLARSRSANSVTGSFLERMGHWCGNMTVVAGAGLQACGRYGSRGAIALTGVCVTQALYLAAVTETHALEVRSSTRVPLKYLLHLVKVQYVLMPIELPFVIVIGVFGSRLVLLWGFSVFLLVAAVTLLFPAWWSLRDFDLRQHTGTKDEFPTKAAKAGQEILAARSSTAAYWALPTRVPQEVLQLLGRQPVPYPGPQSLGIAVEIKKSLQTICQTQGQICLLPCQKSHVAQFLARDLVLAGETVVVVNSGPVAEQWISILEFLGVTVHTFVVPFGEQVSLQDFSERLASLRTAIAVVVPMTETTHGTKYDVAALAACVHEHQALIVVDCTSSIAVDELLLDEWNVDLAIAGTEGGLMTPLNLSVVAFAGPQIVVDARLRLALAHLERWEQLPWSSSEASAFEALHLATQMIVASGVSAILAHRREVGSAFRRGCAHVLGLELVSLTPSEACTIAYLPKFVDPVQLVASLAKKHSVGISTNRTPDGRNTMVIGHGGWVFREDIYELIKSLAIELGNAMPDPPVKKT
jgi:aspartate aminotransferase-like enzyme/phosphatidylglycerophosphate synthase